MPVSGEALEELCGALPGDVVVTGAAAVEEYRFDWSRDPRAGVPAAVVRAGRRARADAVRWAARHRVPVVPRGAGSGLSGGSSAVDGGIVVSLERMRAVEIDTACRVAVVEPGALNVEVKDAAAKEGLWYPPDPSSFEICSIGGNVATNAGGLCCVKYGVTTDYVLGLDVVLADGTLVTLGGKRIKDVAGLSLLKLFVGSEGTLGIVTRAILRLVPAQADRATLVATFDSMTAASRAVVAIGAEVRPRCGADGQRLHQRGRGLEVPRPRPLRRCPDGGAVGRSRCGARARDRGDGEGVRRRGSPGGGGHLRRRGVRDVRVGTAQRVRRPRAEGDAAARGRRCPDPAAAGPRRRHRGHRRTPPGRHPGSRTRRRRQHPPDHRLRPQ